MKLRLSLLYFLQFSIWGCYLPCFGQLLGAGGLGSEIAWFYAAIGIVSIITPPLFGRLADRTGRPERLLCGCHLAAAVVMLVMWRYALAHPRLEFSILYPLYVLFLSLYMPTMALANTAAFGIITRHGKSPVTVFPSIRVWGTVGFVAAMWFVNCAYWDHGVFGFAFGDNADAGPLRFQYNSMQLMCSGIMGMITAAYVIFLPKSTNHRVAQEPGTGGRSLTDSLKIMFGRKEIVVFLIFVIFSGVCLQISNGFVTPFITHFTGIAGYADSIASGNATMLFSLSQISEAACILLVGICMKKRGMRWVYAAGLLAWSLRFLMLGVGNPGSGLWLLIGSMLVYGIAFNFITIAGHLYIQELAPDKMKGFAQGLMMFMSNGIGATIGTLIAGGVVNHWCAWEFVKIPATGMPMRLFMGEWEWPWLIFAAYALIIMLAWLIVSRITERTNKLQR